MSQPGLYVHFPFCLRKCEYCDFNSRVGAADEQACYLRALHAEIAATSRVGQASLLVPPSTLYFGGGTPTVYAPADLAAVLERLLSAYGVPPSPAGRGVGGEASPEITLEANPGTITLDALRELRQAGFNRLSLGVQSLRDDELRLLGRIHTAAEARAAVSAAREAGFDNLSFDLMRGLPGQRLTDWRETLEGAIALAPDHISVYGLTLEEGTSLLERVEAGELPSPAGAGDPHWVELTLARLERAGYRRYEISNYARPGFECRHNLNYWRNGEYLGLGAGAWSYLDGERRRNVAAPAEYVERALRGASLITETERLTLEAGLGETIMLGLRTAEGVDYGALHRRFGIDIRERFRPLIARLATAGLAVDDGTHLRLTFEGMLVQSAIAVEFLA